MAGIFAEWQPRYAEAGIATFPVHLTPEAKRPAVGNYLRAGRRASAQWANKFPEANALGFACGKRNGLTVLDVDEPSENLLADAFAKLGPSPVVIQTASGKFHAWYRHAGEARSIRKQALALGLPGAVDILGAGYAIAPPSRGASGEYRWIQGSLADLASLPAMRSLDCAADECGNGSEQVAEGERNAALFHACMVAAQSAGSLAALLKYGHDLNQSGRWSALPVDEVERAVGSAWRYQEEGRNLVGRGRAVILSSEETSILERDPDGLYLYTMLRKRHWGRDFAIANEWREHLASGAWSLPRFRAARKFLLSSGLVREVRPARRGIGPALFRFSSPVAGIGGEQGGGV